MSTYDQPVLPDESELVSGDRQVDRPSSDLETSIMTRPKNSSGFKGHRFPPAIIEYAVWLYFRFSLSLRDVEDLLAQRGIIVSHETVRLWPSVCPVDPP